MGFFETDEGQVHVGRAALVGYVVLALLCVANQVPGQFGGAVITVALGWSIAFCGKRPPRTWSEYGRAFRLKWGLKLSTVAVLTETIRLLFRHYGR